jgi:hypothetical protein
MGLLYSCPPCKNQSMEWEGGQKYLTEINMGKDVQRETRRELGGGGKLTMREAVVLSMAPKRFTRLGHVMS